jgi:hypothetical protein
MKTLKSIIATTLLALTLSIPAFAGDIDTPGAPVPPPPNSAKPLSTSTALGDIDTPGVTDPSADSSDIFTNILLSMISLF